MPEGHLLHRWANEQSRLIGGQQVAASSPQGRFADGARLLDGRLLDRVEAYGKHLFYWFDGEPALTVHLGMAGFFLFHEDAPTEPKTGVRLRLAAGQAAVDLIAPTKCALTGEPAYAATLARLGPDPLRDDADEEAAVRRLLASRLAIGAALLDQAVWAGLGNAFRAELLYLLRIHPATPAASLGEDTARALWRLAVGQMTTGRDVGTIATVDGTTDAKWVYKRETCRGCDAPVETTPLGGRTSYSCPAEQPAPTAARRTGRR